MRSSFKNSDFADKHNQSNVFIDEIFFFRNEDPITNVKFSSYFIWFNPWKSLVLTLKKSLFFTILFILTEQNMKITNAQNV